VRKEVLEVDARFGKEFAGRYVFEEITWAKRSRIIQKYTKYHPVSGQVLSSDFIAIQAETIWASLKKQPSNKPITFERLLSEEDGVPIGLGELFSEFVNRLNGLTREDLRFLLEQLDEESRIQLFQSFGFAKNSVGPQTSLQGNQQKPSNNSSSSSTS
jgi:hypothetical protein